LKTLTIGNFTTLTRHEPSDSKKSDNPNINSYLTVLQKKQGNPLIFLNPVSAAFDSVNKEKKLSLTFKKVDDCKC
jgi:hypothetical protein